MSILSMHPSHEAAERIPILQRLRGWLKRGTRMEETQPAADKPDLGNVTAAEAKAAIGALLKAGLLSREQSRCLGLAVDVRMLNIRYGDPVPEHFDLLAEARSAIENGKNMGCWDQVQSLTRSLEVMQAYQLDR
ncbi:hypothetical protein J9978_15955 [Chromobacterium violaceum]|uniref:hypothetical protein n=1 Tax=Chromobacterium violaceum TaxID=536 RepID=UPI0009DB5DF5|nr:hypothetical protein [Chromobacterium violaceum]MBP4050981.1 hypothetical protein [Chromobacterium violaceum]OQS30443.1 hypothetical protein B0T41_00365 [Chromobacterium violaceum]